MPAANAIETLRDLLGTARAVYVECAPSAGPIELDELRSLGADLRDAYQRVLRARPRTAACAAAWAKADRATHRLGVLLGAHTSTRALVRAVGSRLGVKPSIPGFDPNAKVRERGKRG
jgi:hypothetical protein